VLVLQFAHVVPLSVSSRSACERIHQLQEALEVRRDQFNSLAAK